MSDSQVAKHGRAAVGERRRPWSRGSDPVVQAVGRVPAKVHTKLLIAFVGTSVLLVAVGLLGLRVLGQSNDRVGSLGSLQERAVGYAGSSRTPSSFESSSHRTRDGTTAGSGPVATPTRIGEEGDPRRPGVADAADRIGPATAVDRLGFTPPAEDADTLASIRSKADRLSSADAERSSNSTRATLAARRAMASASQAEELAQGPVSGCRRARQRSHARRSTT